MHFGVTLTDFLLARIAEEEHHAVYAAHEDQGVCSSLDPDRVIEECQAKRRIVERMVAAARGRCDEADRERDTVVRLLALNYDTHPDYREEWRP